jgi:hypothetical protein
MLSIFAMQINGLSTLLASRLRRACCQAPDLITKNSHSEVVLQDAVGPASEVCVVQALSGG